MSDGENTLEELDLQDLVSFDLESSHGFPEQRLWDNPERLNVWDQKETYDELVGNLMQVESQKQKQRMARQRAEQEAQQRREQELRATTPNVRLSDLNFMSLLLTSDKTTGKIVNISLSKCQMTRTNKSFTIESDIGKECRSSMQYTWYLLSYAGGFQKAKKFFKIGFEYFSKEKGVFDITSIFKDEFDVGDIPINWAGGTGKMIYTKNDSKKVELSRFYYTFALYRQQDICRLHEFAKKKFQTDKQYEQFCRAYKLTNNNSKEVDQFSSLLLPLCPDNNYQQQFTTTQVNPESNASSSASNGSGRRASKNTINSLNKNMALGKRKKKRNALGIDVNERSMTVGKLLNSPVYETGNILLPKKPGVHKLAFNTTIKSSTSLKNVTSTIAVTNQPKRARPSKLKPVKRIPAPLNTSKSSINWSFAESEDEDDGYESSDSMTLGGEKSKTEKAEVVVHTKKRRKVDEQGRQLSKVYVQICEFDPFGGI